MVAEGNTWPNVGKRRSTNSDVPEVSWWEQDPRRRLAFEARYIGRKWETIAKQIGAARDTIDGWRRTPEWKAEFEARDKQSVEDGRQAYRTALRLLIEAGPVMVRKLLKLAHTANEKQAVQLSATKDVLNRAGLAFRPEMIADDERDEEWKREMLDDPQ